MCFRQWVECTGFVGQCTKSGNDIINSHRLEFTERRSGRIGLKKRRRRGVGCCGSNAINFVIKESMKLRSVNVSSRGVLPRPSSASIDRRSWQGLNFSASILSCQKHWRFRRRSALYNAAVASGVFRRRDDLSKGEHMR